MLPTFEAPCGACYWRPPLREFPSQDHVAVGNILIREINATSAVEVELVAQRMRQTLIEVEGDAVGTALYDMPWLVDRVRWHLDPSKCTGAVFIAIGGNEEMLGHTIVRVEMEAPEERFGLFSTTYVIPSARRHSLASQLLNHGEHWMKQLGLRESTTWTSQSNLGLIDLYAKHGYVVTQHHAHETTGTPMVKLTKALVSESNATTSQ